MFASYQAQIESERAEPVGLNLARAIEMVERRNAAVAYRVVTQMLLKTRTQDAARSRLKILREWEFDARLKPLVGFVESWNTWREHYAKVEPLMAWLPKSGSQLTMMENITALARDQGFDLDILIACGHRAYARSRYPVGLGALLSHGVEFYGRHAEDVCAEIDAAERQRQSLECWSE